MFGSGDCAVATTKIDAPAITAHTKPANVRTTLASPEMIRRDRCYRNCNGALTRNGLLPATTGIPSVAGVVSVSTHPPVFPFARQLPTPLAVDEFVKRID